MHGIGMVCRMVYMQFSGWLQGRKWEITVEPVSSLYWTPLVTGCGETRGTFTVML